MRRFLFRRIPPVTRVLLVESGPRELGERAVLKLRQAFGEHTPVDVLHCLADPPGGAAVVWSVRNHVGSGARWRLLRDLRARRHPAVAILAAGDPIMGPWRWAAALALTGKVLIVNENADFFWLDRGNWRTAVGFLRHRVGLGGESTVAALGRLIAFPVAFVYLLAYAGYVHTVRLARMTVGK